MYLFIQRRVRVVTATFHGSGTCIYSFAISSGRRRRRRGRERERDLFPSFLHMC
jgi:hypothetical protein